MARACVPEINHIPIHSMTFFAQTVKYSKCDEYIILFCIRWENDGSWICLVWSSWIHLIEYVRLDIEAAGLKCISVLEEIGLVAICLPFWKTLTLFDMFFHLLLQFTPTLMFSTYSDTTQGNLCWCTLRVGESSKETLQCCCKENFQLENISSSTQFHKRPTPPPPTVWRIEDTEPQPNI